jgi:hypothetical protein
MRLPNPQRAIVDIEKLAGYCLNPQHEDGKHKARVFASALGITRTDAEWLRQRLSEAAFLDASPAGTVRFGELYVIDFQLRTAAGAATVRSGWIVRSNENIPRLTTCYVKRHE